MIALWLLACVELPGSDLDEPEPGWTVAAIRAEEVHQVRLTLPRVLITSPQTRTHTAFFIQDPGGGPGSGMQVALGGALFGWPPPPGQLVSLTGTVTQGPQGPTLTLSRSADAAIVEGWLAPMATPLTSDPLPGDLVSLGPVEVVSSTDPLGRALTDGPLPLGGLFGATPGWSTHGEATGILWDEAVNLRDPHDWTGDWQGAGPIDTTLQAVADGRWPEGTPVSLTDLLQITPWSRGGRHAVLQDASGRGLWLDAQGWGVAGEPGERGDWAGQVRTDGDRWWLEVWEDPEIHGIGTPQLQRSLREGALVQRTVRDVQGPDRAHRWRSGELILDDRFLSLSDLPDPALVVGVVRLEEGQPVVSVLEFRAVEDRPAP